MKSGIIAVDKPEGISSAAVVARVKKTLGVKKAGHTGTLDPFATGLMLCAVNQATRISRFFLGGHKRYLATLHLGVETDTYDLTGKTESTAPDGTLAAISDQDVVSVIDGFSGPQEQVAPSFSALKHQGQPLYKLARQGKMIVKPPRRIEIFSIRVLSIEMPFIEIDVHCSAGTYIRSLAFDIGRKLGCGAHLSALCRTGSSHFDLEKAIPLEQFEALDRETALSKLIPMADCLSFMPDVRVDEAAARKIKFGQKLSLQDIGRQQSEPGRPVRLLDDEERLLAVVSLDENLLAYNYSCVFAG